MDRSSSPDAAATRVYRIATRESPLAIWQAQYVAELLSRHGVETLLVPLVSRGDVDMRPIDGTRQVGLFTKRIQQALLDDEADIAVHSLKDLPTEENPSLVLAAVPDREIVNDCLVSAAGWMIDELPEGARIGTGSRRRAAQLKTARGDLQILPIRGNVQTRLKKLADREYDAIVLAEAGLLRLQMTDVNRSQLSLEVMLPAPGQGALGIEVRSHDQAARDIVGRLDHAATRSAVTAERTLLATLHGGCLAPIAAYCVVVADVLQLRAIVASTDGKKSLFAEASAPFSHDAAVETGAALGDRVATRLIQDGAGELIEQAR